MKYFLLLLSITLFISHSIFFLRAIYYRNKKFTPKTIDRSSKLLSIFLLIPTFIIGSITFKSTIWSVIIWTPVLLIIISNFNRVRVKKHPYILPLLNLIFILLTVILSVREALSL